VTTPTSPPVAVCYLRLSPKGRPDTGLGIAAQRDQCLRLARNRLEGWDLRWVEEHASGTLAARQRPALAQTLRQLDRGTAQALVVARLDRLTRRTRDLLEMVDRAHESGWRLLIRDLDVDTASPMGRAIFTVMGALAQLERDLTVQRTNEAIAEARRRGTLFGPPTAHSPATLAEISELREYGYTLQAIADHMNDQGIPTALGAKWRRNTVARALKTAERHEAARILRQQYQGNLFE